MKQLEIYDAEQQRSFMVMVDDDAHDEIVLRNNMALAQTLVNREQEKQNFIAAYNLIHEKPVEQQSTNHSYESYKTLDTSSDMENMEIKSPASDSKMWTTEATTLLISLCQKYDNDFETGIKKYVWNKIAKELSEKCGHLFTYQQCDTKFKGLKTMYKQVKNQNQKSGNNTKTWKYFDLMDDILFSKPEINPIATCSSKSGLILRSGTAIKNVENCKPDESDNEQEPRQVLAQNDNKKCSDGYTSNFMAKRKHCENAVERRHREKMAKQDKYLTLLERITTAIECNCKRDSKKDEGNYGSH